MSNEIKESEDAIRVNTRQQKILHKLWRWSTLPACLLLLIISPLAAPAASTEAQREWRDEVVYVVIVHKFWNGDSSNDVMLRRFGKEKAHYEGGFLGGDLAGIIQKLDYLESLGVTSLLLYPVMANDVAPFGKYLPTGYRPRDYFQVDENFGSLETLKDLVARAHQRKLKVILDLPLGMAGPEHPYRRDPSKKAWFGKATPYGVTQWDADHPEVAEYLLHISRFWRDETGCDGLRLDSAQLHSQKFWANYAQAIRDPQHREFVLLGEMPVHPSKIGEFLTASGFDSAYDFSAMTGREVFGKGADVRKLSFVLREGKRYYPFPERLCAQIDNYEDPTFMGVVLEPKEARLRMGTAYQMTLDRVPLIYSGAEAATDYREVGALFAPHVQSSPFLTFIKSLIALRRAEPALRRGQFEEVSAQNSIYAYLRALGERRILVVLNNSAERQQVGFPILGKAWRNCAMDDLLSGKSAKGLGAAEPMEIEPFGVRILAINITK